MPIIIPPGGPTGYELYTFGELQTEVFERGFTYLNSSASGISRVKKWINLAYMEICDLEEWPFLQDTAQGPAPVEISDLGAVQSVIDSGTLCKLEPANEGWLSSMYPDLTVEGSPRWYYITLGNTISVYPANTSDSLTVRYWKTPVALSADSDVPIIPGRFQELIVLGALRRGFLEDSDAGDYASVDQEWQRGVELMRERLLVWQHDRPDRIAVTDTSGDW